MKKKRTRFQFVIVDKITGEVHDNCYMCGVVGTGDIEKYENYPIDENHSKAILNNDDVPKLYEYDEETGREMKFKLNKKTGRLELKEKFKGG